MDLKIEVWSKDFCPFCTKARVLLDDSGLPYKYLTLNKDFSESEARQEFPRSRTYPKILIDGHWIGGYDELVRILGDEDEPDQK